jgi:hypothetical protein
MRYLKKEKSGKFAIKKIILNDGREIETDKMIHVSIFKTGEENNIYKTDLSFNLESSIDFKEMSNRCFMYSFAFNLMDKFHISFEEACSEYDKMIDDVNPENEKNSPFNNHENN